MKRIVFLAICVIGLLVISLQKAQAQERTVEGKEHFWKYSRSLSDVELYRYERLMYMSREDWDLFRQDPRFSHERVEQVYHDHHAELPVETAMTSKMPDSECDCWIEPDLTYEVTTPETNTGWTCEGGAGDGVDCFMELDLPFNFCFYGTNYTSVFLTSKGTIAFGGGYYDWTPSEFPTAENGNPEYNHICGLWADFDFRQSGTYYYKVTNEALYVNFVDVGYYSNHADKRNTFQMILTSESSEILSNGHNVQFCYKDMNWCHGDVGGSGGCCGPYPANVGADKNTGSSHIQYGRFNILDGTYNGPYGANANQQDGVDWLDNKVLEFNVCEAATNIAPLGTQPVPCETTYLCIGNCMDLSGNFLAPETNQSVTITYVETGNGGGLTATVTNGNNAAINAEFCATANNVGVHTVTITATDNGTPVQSTTVTYTIEVLNVVPPPLTIDGLLTVCAGGTTELTASSGFDSYQWSGNSTSENCPTPNCVFTGGGIATVTGTLDQCEVTTQVTITETEFEYIDWLPGPGLLTICQSDSAQICIEDVAQYIPGSFEWGTWPGYCADISPYSGETTDTCIWVYGGCESHISLYAYDTTGCQQFNIPVVFITGSTVGDENIQYEDYAECSGNLEPIPFCCGYTSPAEGWMNLYLNSGSSQGWAGAQAVVTITPCNGDPEYELIFTSTTYFEFFSIPIQFCDEICIEYIEGGVTDANNSIYIYNCSNQNALIYGQGTGLESGEIWCGISGCTASELPGTWEVDGPAGWSMTDLGVYNPIDDYNYFTPGNFGLYTLTFTDPDCAANAYTYEIEFNAPPTIQLDPGYDLLLCSGESAYICTEYTNLGGPETMSLDWDGSGVDPDPNEECATIGPYNNYATVTVNVEIQNGCGTAEDELTVTAQPNVPEPSLADALICPGESSTLDPIPNNLDNPNLVYDWSTGATTSTINASTNDEYCVTVSNQCDESNEACADIQIVLAAQSNQLNDELECNDGSVTLTVNVPSGYTATWSTGQTGSSITVSSSGNYSVVIADNEGCNTTASSSANITISTDPTANGGGGNPVILCPGQCVTLDMQSTNGSNYSWDVSCQGINLSGGEQAQFCSDQVPTACLGGQVTVTGIVSNVCGTAETQPWIFLPDACEVTIPNIFTPNGDEYNPFFYIVGLENYLSAKFFVYDRWGGEVYSSDNYKNNWGPRDMPPGTYYYILQLPYGTKTDFEGYFTLLSQE